MYVSYLKTSFSELFQHASLKKLHSVSAGWKTPSVSFSHTDMVENSAKTCFQINVYLHLNGKCKIRKTNSLFSCKEHGIVYNTVELRVF